MKGYDDTNLAQSGTKRQKIHNAIQWDTYFMATAFLARYRSNYPDYPVGVCIVNADRKIVGTGYNGFPIGCSDHELIYMGTHSLRSYECHAEMNAIIFRNTPDFKGCTLYVSAFPCNECAKIIIQSGIEKVIYCFDEKSHEDIYKASKRMFDAADVKYEKFVPELSKLLIDFTSNSLPDANQ